MTCNDALPPCDATEVTWESESGGHYNLVLHAAALVGRALGYSVPPGRCPCQGGDV